MRTGVGGYAFLLKEDTYTEISVITITGFLPYLSATIPHNMEESALPNIYEAPSLITKTSQVYRDRKTKACPCDPKRLH